MARQLVADAALGLKDAADEKRESIDERVAKLREILARSDALHPLARPRGRAPRDQGAVPERSASTARRISTSASRRSSTSATASFQYLSTKPEIAGSGCNFQRHCHKAVFVGIDYKFNDFIQAIHRIQRFQQTHPVDDPHHLHRDPSARS
jgi:hypothetical protein